MSIPEGLAEYLYARQLDRDQALAAAVGRLSERELALVREAAVMGYVQGVRSSGVAKEIPNDRVIVTLVVGSAPSFADLYPTLAGLFQDVDEEVT